MTTFATCAFSLTTLATWVLTKLSFDNLSPRISRSSRCWNNRNLGDVPGETLRKAQRKRTLELNPAIADCNDVLRDEFDKRQYCSFCNNTNRKKSTYRTSHQRCTCSSVQTACLTPHQRVPLVRFAPLTFHSRRASSHMMWATGEGLEWSGRRSRTEGGKTKKRAHR